MLELGPLDPRRIGPFRIVGRLGAGGMGLIYAGQDSTGRRAAVKVVQPQLAHDSAFRTRFAREAILLGRVDGACTARVLAADVDAEPPYLALEYVEGPTLAEYVEAHGPLSPALLQPLAVGLAEALSAIHAAGVVHRDLKPANVILSSSGPKVLDFGVAYLAGATNLTSSGVIMGSPGWMAPEQFSADSTTTASDVFAWASTVYFAATGQPPFGGGNLEGVYYRILSAEPDLAAVPASVVGPLTAAFRKDPSARATVPQILQSLTGRTDDVSSNTTQLLRSAWTYRATPGEPWPIPGSSLAPEFGTRVVRPNPEIPHQLSSSPGAAPSPSSSGRKPPRLLIGATFASVLLAGVAATIYAASAGNGADPRGQSVTGTNPADTQTAAATTGAPTTATAGAQSPTPDGTKGAKASPLLSLLAPLKRKPEQCPLNSYDSGCSVKLTEYSPDSDTFYQPPQAGPPINARIALVGPVTTRQLPLVDGTTATARGIFIIARVYVTALDKYIGLSARDFEYFAFDPKEKVVEGGVANQTPSDSRHFDLPELLTSEIVVPPGVSAAGLVVLDVPEPPQGWKTGIAWSRPGTPDGAGTSWSFSLA